MLPPKAVVKNNKDLLFLMTLVCVDGAVLWSAGWSAGAGYIIHVPINWDGYKGASLRVALDPRLLTQWQE